jgi:hypothetical protein
MRIAVIGYSGKIDQSPVRELRDLCLALGKQIARQGHSLWSGGRDGVMALTSMGAASENGEVFGVLPYDEQEEIVQPCPYVKYPIYTGLDFQMRSCVLLKNADLVISIGGACGTAIEIFGAYGYGKPLVLMKNTGGVTERIAGWFDRSAPPLYLDYRKSAPVYIETNVEELTKYYAR